MFFQVKPKPTCFKQSRLVNKPFCKLEFYNSGTGRLIFMTSYPSIERESVEGACLPLEALLGAPMGVERCPIFCCAVRLPGPIA